MLMPKRTKYRKQFRGRMSGAATRGNTICFGDYALVAMDCAWPWTVLGSRPAKSKPRVSP